MKWALPATSLHMSFFCIRVKLKKKGIRMRCLALPKSPRLQQFLKGSLK